MTAQTPPARPPAARPPLRHSLLALLLSAALAGAAWSAAVMTAPDDYVRPLAAGAAVAGVALCAAVVLAVRAAGRHRALLAEVERERAVADAFAGETVPALVARLRTGTPPEKALAALPEPPDDNARRIMRLLATEIARSETAKAAATAACANAAARMQALATSTLASLREMEHRHTDEAVLEDLLDLDHRTAQAGRLADSIAVLTGARSGRRWPRPIAVESVLRGAMSRISGYRRVRLHSALDVSVAGHAAEGVIHALAELLDNATNFSPPTSEVHVYTEAVPAGIVITVEDSGLVMGEGALRRAEAAVAGEALDLTTLAGTRLGLAVVGALSRRHGLSVSFRPSARGGTGALLLVPQALVVLPEPGDGRPGAAPIETGRTVRTRPGGPARTPPAAPRPTDIARDPDRQPAAPSAPGGLPRRRRGRTLPARTTGADREPRALPGSSPSPTASAARLGAFHRAAKGVTARPDRPATPPEETAP
ncbi:ATP-binding protein [Streptomyces sp. RFCAC02]|uniref:ATP-binding protein n=1 Tax=Streptomyces sp. RFCAC02 TaxID=2499143 RepID=UPI001021F57A|nr:ATP-binding protein [Streptomyces sp. RFCAC02]